MEFSQRGSAGDYAGDYTVDADEEEKMEEFFAILRRFRHACADRRGRTADGEGGRPAKRRKVAAAPAPARSSWVPKFEWEDFNTAVEFRGPVVSADSAPAVEKKENTEEIKGKGKSKEEDENSQLKLTLSL